MKVRDDGEVIAIELFDKDERPWQESSFPTELITVDHGDDPETGERGVIGLEFIGSAAEELRKGIFGRRLEELRGLREREALRSEQQGSE